MTTNYFEIRVSFATEDATDENFEDFIECVVDELAQLGQEVDVTGSGAAREASFLMPVEQLSDDALIAALTDLRTALHAAQCATPGWPDANEILSTRAVYSRELQPA